MYSSALKSPLSHLLAVADPIARRTSSLGASIVRLSVFSVVFCLFASFASAASVNLAWDAVTAPDLAGYKVHYGTASRKYSSTVDAGKSTTAAISGLQEGKTYFFAATAYDTKGNSSGFSNEVSHTVPELDTDNDGLKDHEEIKIYGTDPNRADTDGDGLRDGDEIKIHHTDPKSVDMDGDGLSDKDEIQVYKTDPTQNDSDRDGTPDGVEVSKGSNPLDPKSIPNSNAGLFAVNAGGAQYKDATGLVYQADSRFSGGKTAGTTAPIAGTTDDALYQKVRFGDFSYAIPLPDGDYLVTLKFAETYFTKAGQRVFDVAIEGVDVLNDLDLVAEAGPKTAYDLTVPAQVTDGMLNINFRSIVNYALVNAVVVMGAAAAH